MSDFRPVTERLMSVLRSRGIEIRADGDDLVVGPAHLLTDGDRQAIRKLKPQLLAMIQAEDNCRNQHHMPGCWSTERVRHRPGWSRTVCSSCGRFIGYSPLPSDN